MSTKFQNSIFKVFVDKLSINFLEPWAKKYTTSTGTAFAVSIKNKPYYMTCRHVVSNGKIININGKEEKILYYSILFDVAILTCSSTVEPLEFGEVQTGDDITIPGYPLSLSNMAIVTGRVSRLTKIRWFYCKRLVFSIDAHLFSGNSGSPVLNKAGQVCGIFFGTVSYGLSTISYYITPYFFVDYVVNLFSAGQQINYKIPTFTWQIVDSYMPFKERVIIDKKRYSQIEGIDILENGQIYLKDMLNLLGYNSQSEEKISFHYLIPFLSKKTVLMDKTNLELKTYAIENTDEPEYLVFGDFVFVPFSKGAVVQTEEIRIKDDIFSPLNFPHGPKGEYYVFIAYSHVYKYNHKILNIFWDDFVKLIKNLKQTISIKFLGDNWELFLNEKDKKKPRASFLFSEN